VETQENKHDGDDKNKTNKNKKTRLKKKQPDERMCTSALTSRLLMQIRRIKCNAYTKSCIGRT
jgi:hypothetical protein